MKDWGSCTNLYTISVKCFGIDANGGHEDEYGYYCSKLDNRPLDYDKMRNKCLKCTRERNEIECIVDM